MSRDLSPGDFMRSIWARLRLLVVYKLGAKPPIDFCRRLVPAPVQRNAVALARQGYTWRSDSGGEALDVICRNQGIVFRSPDVVTSTTTVQRVASHTAAGDSGRIN
jgi:hypothetical protein